MLCGVDEIGKMMMMVMENDGFDNNYTLDIMHSVDGDNSSGNDIM